MNAWMDGWMDGWMDVKVCMRRVYLNTIRICHICVFKFVHFHTSASLASTSWAATTATY